MIICTPTISQKYEIIDTVFALHGEEAGGFLGTGSVDVEKGLQYIKSALAEKARAVGADAVIGVDFEHRAAAGGVMGDKQVLEFFAYGTAVSIIE